MYQTGSCQPFFTILKLLFTLIIICDTSFCTVEVLVGFCFLDILGSLIILQCDKCERARCVLKLVGCFGWHGLLARMCLQLWGFLLRLVIVSAPSVSILTCLYLEQCSKKDEKTNYNK